MLLLSPHWPAYLTNKNTWQGWGESGFLPSNFSRVPSPCCLQYSARSATKTKVKVCYSHLPITLPMVLSQRQLRKKEYYSLGTNYCIRHLHLKLKKDKRHKIRKSVSIKKFFSHTQRFPKIWDSLSRSDSQGCCRGGWCTCREGIAGEMPWHTRFLVTEVESVHRGSLLIKYSKSKLFLLNEHWVNVSMVQSLSLRFTRKSAVFTNLGLSCLTT